MNRPELRTYIPVDEPDEGPNLRWFRVVDEGSGATFEVHADEIDDAVELSKQEAASRGIELSGQIFVRRNEPVWRQELEMRFGTDFKANAVEPNSSDRLGSHNHSIKDTA